MKKIKSVNIQLKNALGLSVKRSPLPEEGFERHKQFVIKTTKLIFL